MINDKIYSLRKVPGCLQRHSMWSSNLIQLLPSASQRQNQFSGALTNIAVHIPINKKSLESHLFRLGGTKTITTNKVLLYVCSVSSLEVQQCRSLHKVLVRSDSRKPSLISINCESISFV